MSEAELKKLLYANAKYIIGLDEAGAGAWAGPLVVAGAVFEKSWSHKGIRDSKKYTNTSGSTAHDKRMKAVNTIVKPAAVQWYISTVTAERIDKINLSTAKMEAFREAAKKLLSFYPDSVIVIDGNQHFGVVGNVICIPKADDLVPAVSAASLLAKTHRDKYMHNVHKSLPEFGFERHVGYGTKEHKEAIEKLGALQGVHRMTFKPIRDIENDRPQVDQ